MIRRSVKVQLVAFLVITLLAVSFLSARYVGLGEKLFGGGYVVTADFADSGGIFSGAEVTYRGVQVGRVDRLRLTPGGVLVDLRLDKGTKVPTDAKAVVADRSAVGEQYVDLEPARNSGPYLAGGSRIARADTAIPVPVATVLKDIDMTVSSVDRNQLVSVVDELGTAFASGGQDLQRLLDSGDALTRSATQALPQTIQLINDGSTVLATQQASSASILSFSKDLRLLSGTVKAHDADVRTILDRGTLASAEVTRLLQDSRTGLATLLANLVTVGQVTAANNAGLRQILVTYPDVVAGSFTVLPGDGTAHFGMVLNANDPPACLKGYTGTRRTDPDQTTNLPPLNMEAHCGEPAGSATGVRDAQNAPGAR
jgi:phospholipid/cholesterol/gamma-HCH transport system substrate-binding protein